MNIVISFCGFLVYLYWGYMCAETLDEEHNWSDSKRTALVLFFPIIGAMALILYIPKIIVALIKFIPKIFIGIWLLAKGFWSLVKDVWISAQ